MIRALTWVAAGLTIIGALNWGLVGLFRFNLVHTLFGPFERAIYTLVGFSSLLLGFSLSQSAQEDLMKH